MLSPLILLFFLGIINVRGEGPIPQNPLYETYLKWAKKNLIQPNLKVDAEKVLEKASPKPKGCVRESFDSFQPFSPTSSPSENILVFVSLSMPEASLKRLAKEALNHNAVLILRGLVEDSFQKTGAKLQELGVSLELHPELFERFRIERVPTFVLVKNGHELARLSGNVTLPFAHKKLQEGGL